MRRIYEKEGLSLYYLGNCAVLVKCGERSVLMDGFVSDDNLFSPPNPEDERKLFGEAPPTQVFFTHRHGDHYDKEKTKRFRKAWPEAELILPGEAPKRRKFGEDFKIETLKCAHMGESRDVNWSFNLIFPDANILFTADMELAELPRLREFKRKDTSIGFFNPMALWHRKSREDIAELALSRVFFYHLADEAHDRLCYRAQTLRYWEKFKGEIANAEVLL